MHALDYFFLRFLKVLRLTESFIQLSYQESLPFQCLEVFYSRWCRATEKHRKNGEH